MEKKLKKKTIIYIGGFELPDKNAAAQRVISNGKILRDLGFNVVYIGIDKSLSSNFHIKNTSKKILDFDTWRIPYPNNKKQWLKQITTIEYIKYVIDNYYDKGLFAIICYNHPAIAQYRIQKICKKMNILSITDVTEWYESDGGSFLFNFVKWLDTTFRMRIVNKKADGIITVSNFLTNFYKANNNIIEIPTLFDVNDLNKNLHVADEKRCNKIKFIYAGSAFNILRINKNRTNIKDRLDKVITIFGNIYNINNNFIFNIYGLSKENYLFVFPEHKELLSILHENIIFHGRKNHLEIIKNIKQSDFTIFIRETTRVIEAGFPSKFSESISCGTPVITNIMSNIKNYVNENENSLIIDLNDIKKQEELILKVLSMKKEEIESMKRYCLDSKIFHYEKFLSEMDKFLKKVEKYDTI